MKKSKRFATIGLLTALAFIFSYLESLLPVPLPVPGVKLGLANLVVLVALYIPGAKEAFALFIVRILLVGFTFGSPSTLLFSLAGGLLSFVVMWLLSRFEGFSIIGVSVAGGIMHNVGQLLTAAVVVKSGSLLYYMPVLLIAGVLTGLAIGLIGGPVRETVVRSGAAK
ncbi:MAG: Gx transporter family protein [Lachnospiraceae bacterium]|nr:Gx transporter family protein [Lachnospiraceae bacterium]MDY5741878.1 Gx transporter family protein [Lachnospiraceae bacterium]